MTEKQYTIVNMGLDGQYIKENGKIMTIERVVDLLNEQHEEKEELIDALNQRTEQCDKLHEENKRLQGRIQEYEEIICGYIDENEEIRKKVNALHEENQELRMDNDIKFWKHECLREANTNSIFAFELGKAIKEGYNTSERFNQMINEWKKETEKMKEKHKRLFE